VVAPDSFNLPNPAAVTVALGTPTVFQFPLTAQGQPICGVSAEVKGNLTVLWSLGRVRRDRFGIGKSTLLNASGPFINDTKGLDLSGGGRELAFFIVEPVNNLMTRYEQTFILNVEELSGAIISLTMARTVFVEVTKVNITTIAISVD